MSADRRAPVPRYPGLTKVTSARTGRVSYELRWSRQVAGRRVYGTKRLRTLAEGRAEWAKQQTAIHDGTAQPATRETVGAYAARWFDRQEALGAWRSSTAYHRRKQYDKYLKDTLGGLRLTAVTRPDCQRIIDGMVAAGAKPNTVLTIHSLLSGLFHAAEVEELIPRNPARHLTLPTPRPAPVTTWTGPQVAAFLAATADDPDAPLWALLLTTGVRIGEALALRWADVDLADGTATIRATLRQQTDGTTAPAEGTKSGVVRVVPLTPETVAALTAHRECQTEARRQAPVWDLRGFVFTDNAGRPTGYKGVAARWARAVSRAGLPPMTIHGTRHTVATLAMERGMPAVAVSRLLGHKKVLITLDTYSHVDTAMQRQVSEALRAAITTECAKSARKRAASGEKSPEP